MTNQCPICDGKMKHTQEILNDRVCEEWLSCKTCRYLTGYAYGVTSFQFPNGKTIGWNDNTPNEEVLKLSNEVASAIREAQRDWKASLPIGHA